jgi:chromosome segregation ATPase
LLVETLSSLETDVAKNFSVISHKFNSISIHESNAKFELEANADQMESFDKKLSSLERRIKLVSARDDEIWKQIGSINENIQGFYKHIGKTEDKISDLELSRLEDERS